MKDGWNTVGWLVTLIIWCAIIGITIAFFLLGGVRALP